MDDTHFKPPAEVDGAPVEAHLDDTLETLGEVWVTLVPEDEHDERLWEFSLTTGRIILVEEGGA